MNEIRRDYLLDRWVIIASERAKRPDQFKIEEEKEKGGKCPFCEIEMPILEKIGDVKAIPNKYPALIPEYPLEEKKNFFNWKTGVGYHEVIIETSKHKAKLWELSKEEIVNIIRMYISRTRELYKDERIRHVLIFRNKGAKAGASIPHPHSQIIALPFIPREIERELRKAEEFYALNNKCAFCEIIERERGERLLWENKNFVAIAPFASRFPGETWILPKRHIPQILDLKEEEIYDFAEILKIVLSTMNKLFPNFPFNFAIHSQNENYYHFHLEIYPRLSIEAGFELGSDMWINVLPPENYVREFKNVLV